jgi:hypothetical protein
MQPTQWGTDVIFDSWTVHPGVRKAGSPAETLHKGRSPAQPGECLAKNSK